MVAVCSAFLPCRHANIDINVSWKTNIVNEEASKDAPMLFTLFQQVLQLRNRHMVELKGIVLIVEVIAVVKGVNGAAVNIKFIYLFLIVTYTHFIISFSIRLLFLAPYHIKYWLSTYTLWAVMIESLHYAPETFWKWNVTRVVNWHTHLYLLVRAAWLTTLSWKGWSGFLIKLMAQSASL